MKNFWRCNYIRLIELALLPVEASVLIGNISSFIRHFPHNLSFLMYSPLSAYWEVAVFLFLIFCVLCAFWFLPPAVLIVQLVRHRKDTESQQGMAVMFGVLAVCFHYVFFIPYLIQW